MNWMATALVSHIVLTLVFIAIIYVVWRLLNPGKKW